MPGLLFGTPAFELAAGHYSIRVLGDFVGESGNAWMDVVSQGGRWRLGSYPLLPGVGTVGAFNLVLDEDTRDVQVRIMVDAGARLLFQSLEIVPAT